MTVDEHQPATATDDEGPAESPSSDSTRRSEAAIERYRASMRRPRLVYAVVVSAVVAALVVVVAVAWSHGEAAHVTLHTAAHPAPSIALQNPSATLQVAWQQPERTAIGTPYWSGTVVTYTNDSVRGRNGRTGALTWSYTRTDRTMCQAIQSQGVTVAIFRHSGNCDEVTALDTSTGARKWTRTLDQDGDPINGTPTYVVALYTIMIWTPHVIYAIDPNSGLDRWTFTQPTCTINGATIGSAGALISQTCTHPNCAGLKFCGTGPQLLLRDGNAGHSDDDKDKANPDMIKWMRVGNTDIPVSADQLISALDTSAGQLETFDATKGSTQTLLTLHNANTTGSLAIATQRAELIWLGGTTYSVDVSGSQIMWSALTASPPTVTQRVGQLPTVTPDAANSTIAVPSANGIELLDGATGNIATTVAVSPPAAGSSIYPFGSGYVVAGPSTTVYQ